MNGFISGWSMISKIFLTGSCGMSKLEDENSIDVSKSHPAVVNDEKLYADAKPALMDLNYVELRRPVLIAEDFSFFEQQLPGVFFFVGTGSGIPLHSDDYDFDDSVIIEGVKLFNALFTELP